MMGCVRAGAATLNRHMADGAVHRRRIPSILKRIELDREALRDASSRLGLALLSAIAIAEGAAVTA